MSFPPRLPVMATHCQKKIKADDLSIRSQYRVACEADVVISHVLPYLLMNADDNDESSGIGYNSYASSDSESIDSEGL